jgi:hypothetical protein
MGGLRATIKRFDAEWSDIHVVAVLGVLRHGAMWPESTGNGVQYENINRWTARGVTISSPKRLSPPHSLQYGLTSTEYER